MSVVGCALERADDRLGLAHGLIVGAAVRIAAAIKIVGIALEGGGEMDRRHDRAGALVDGPQRLGGEGARAQRPRVGHSARPLKQLGRAAPRAARFRDQHVLEGRRAINETKPEIAHEAQRRKIVGKQAIERVQTEAAGRNVEATLTLVVCERPRRAGIKAEPHLADDRLGERGDVAQAKVQTLPRKGMHDMGGVANQRKPPGDKAPRDLKAERKGFDARGQADRAQLRGEAIFELTRQILGVERQQRLCVGAAFVPDDARLAARKRQERERAGRQEMLLRPAFVVALVRDRRDDAGLVIVPADGLDLGEPRKFRARAIRGDREARAQHARRRIARAPPMCLPGVQRATDSVMR